MITVKFKSTDEQRFENASTERSAYVLTSILNWRIGIRPNTFHPPTDLYETDNKLVVRVEIAGVNDNDFIITFDQNILTISGVRNESPERKAYHQMEIHFGEFSTAIEVPVPIDKSKIEAVYENGFLWVFLPKATPQQIRINNKE